MRVDELKEKTTILNKDITGNEEEIALSKEDNNEKCTINLSSEQINQMDDEDKLKYLKEIVFKGEYIAGKVAKIKNEDNKHYAFIQIVQAIDLTSYFKLDGKDWSVYCNLKQIDGIADNLKFGDYVYFKPLLSNHKDGKNIIRVDEKTFRKLTNYKEFLSQLNINTDDIILSGFTAVENKDNINLWASKEILQSLKLVHKDILREVAELTDEADRYRLEIDEKLSEKLFLEEELKSLEYGIQENTLKIKEQEKILNYWGFEKVLGNETSHLIEYGEKCSLDDQIDYLRSYLFQKCDLEYREEIIRRFLLAVKCNELIILSGPSGTGKTSLVNGFAQAIGGNVKIISVKPSWTETEDLIGFYNPIEKSYISTPFLDSILDAKKDKNSDKLYLICLDEMNIAHVEYYFAEFLSKLELNKDSRFIELYSEEIYKDILSEVITTIELLSGETLELSCEKIGKWCEQNNRKYPEYILEIRKKIKFIDKYPARLEIPQNIRFVGTMNVDHTTKVISPKVIDRSFIIELTLERLKEVERAALLKNTVVQKIVNIEDLSFNNIVFEDESLVEDMNEINDNYLKYLMCDFNNRGEKHIKNYICTASTCKFDNSEIFSDLMYMKVLPRLNITFRSGDEKLKYWKELNINYGKYYSKDLELKISKMDNILNNNRILSFWSVY